MWSGNRSHKLGFFVYISGIQNPSCWVDEHPLVVWRVPNFETTTYLVWDQSSAHIPSNVTSLPSPQQT